MQANIKFHRKFPTRCTFFPCENRLNIYAAVSAILFENQSILLSSPINLCHPEPLFQLCIDDIERFQRQSANLHKNLIFSFFNFEKIYGCVTICKFFQLFNFCPLDFGVFIFSHLKNISFKFFTCFFIFLMKLEKFD